MKTRTGISDLEYPDGRMAHTDVEKAELLKSFFSDVFTEEDLATIPTFEQRAYREPLTDITINDNMVAAVLGRLKPNKFPGGDGLHPRVLVELKNEMATPLRMIVTRSLHDGQLPPSWKEANVTPIYKKGKRHVPGNYRPVSLTSMAGKCMERLIRDAVMTHMTENDLLSPKQHSFIQGRSCVTQLLAVLDSWTLALDEGGNIDTIYIDFAKALDTVPHQCLLMKLRGYGIEGRILTWIEAFLTGRIQRVVVNDSRSSWADATMPCHPQFCHPSTSLLTMPRSIETFHRTTTLPHSSTTFSNWRNGQRNGSYVLTQTSVRSCTSVDKTPVKTTPWAEQRWLQHNNQREGPWRVRRHRIDFRETHRDCCKPGQQNARTHPSVVYLPRQPVTAETVYQSCLADARVCKCSMDSYPETRPNPTRECSATSNEADTRATRQRL